ncbi:MAG: methyltransferase domain-containing protein [Hyphomicrobiales bacterium]|nr:methyltransferase domain-containing protein [Hyphomicrobiales bacterium]
MSGAREQTWSAAGYDENARFVSDLATEIMQWLAPKPGERILDLGCGDGALTAGLVRAGAEVIGIDASEPLLQAARQRGIDARLMDGEALMFNAEFDAVFSNAALHWMTQPQLVIDGVKRALKPGGRFVAEFGGHGNVSAIVTAMRSAAVVFKGDAALAGPWFYPTDTEYRAMLEASGFQVRRIGLFYRPTPLKTGIEGWLTTFRKPFFQQYDGLARDAVLEHVVNLLRASLQNARGEWLADYVRLRVEAVLPQA